MRGGSSLTEESACAELVIKAGTRGGKELDGMKIGGRNTYGRRKTQKGKCKRLERQRKRSFGWRRLWEELRR